MIDYQWTSTFIGVLIAGLILFLVRRDHLHGPYAVWWLVVATTVVVLGVFPGLFDKVAPFFGVAYPPILAVVLGMGLLLLKVLTMDLERSRQERRLRRLVQRLAILEADLEKAQRTRQAHEEDGGKVLSSRPE
ncbi:conserved hypothetical protein [Nitrosococcus halophilus Nc 4]|uniref:DUF2304 domain-containing protein n=1 Tax=Nitrosococcus halophilus (strain Nc4) TaxID=472759 RepID=D5C291_NITHN|nr:DUF2304 domain-containing protein [Nitrosococcus halophilus]ADE16679.1 conserved hypothetical protein [Nitrosococcus halophilus Nc 4]